MLEKFLKELNEILKANNMKGVEKILDEYTNKYYDYIRQGKREFEVMLLLGEPETVAEFYISNGIFPTENDIKQLEKDRTIRRDELEFDNFNINNENSNNAIEESGESCHILSFEDTENSSSQMVNADKKVCQEIIFSQPDCMDFSNFIKKESDYLTSVMHKESCACDNFENFNMNKQYGIDGVIHNIESVSSKKNECSEIIEKEIKDRFIFWKKVITEKNQPNELIYNVTPTDKLDVCKSVVQHGARFFENKLNENIKESIFILENERKNVQVDMDNNPVNVESEKKICENKFYINNGKLPTKGDIVFNDIFMCLMCLLVCVGSIALFVVAIFIGAVGGMYTVASWIEFEGIKMQIGAFILSLSAIAITALFAYILIIIIKSMIKSIKKHIIDKKEMLNYIKIQKYS